MFTNANITIFNKRLDKESRRHKFIPTVIRGVSYVEAKGATIASNGVWDDNINYKIRIPIMAKVQNERVYVPELEYSRLDEEEAAKHWTISKADLIIKGEFPGDGSAVFEDSIKGLVKGHALDLIHVAEYADDTAGGSLYMKHYRIGGK